MSQTLPRIDFGVAEPALTAVSAEDEFGSPDLTADPIQGALGDPSICASIVVPYYNPGDRLRPTVEHMVQALNECGITFEIIAVSDGSTDGSSKTLDGMPEKLVRQVSYPVNAGKGNALRVGFGLARGDYVGFIDADGDISPDFLAEFVATMLSESPDLVIGTKRHPESIVNNSFVRRAYSWGYQSLVRILFSLDVKDTQVGIKLMNRRVMDEVLPLLQEDRFALDLELLVLAKSRGFTRIVEAPVRIEERSRSTISLKSVRRLLVDTATIFWRLSVRRGYSHDPANQPWDTSGAGADGIESGLSSSVAI